MQGEKKAPVLLLWFVDTDTIKAFSASAATATPTHQDDHAQSSSPNFLHLPSDLPDNSLSQQQEQWAELKNHTPISHHWDPEEQHVLAVEWALHGKGSSLDSKVMEACIQYELRVDW